MFKFKKITLWSDYCNYHPEEISIFYTKFILQKQKDPAVVAAANELKDPKPS
jgi:hypothetical protein